jgi:hypothetical protein
MFPKRFAFVLFFIGLSFTLHAQDTLRIKGKVVNMARQPIPGAHLFFEGTSTGTTTNGAGFFQLVFRPGESDSLVVSSVGYHTRKLFGEELLSEDSMLIVLKQAVQEIDRVQVTARWRQDASLIKIDKKDFEMLPTAAGEVEAMVKKMPGVASRSELSSQYSVRGGNFDENLVYVNGIEVYRPIMIRNGKHEGLSFLNSDMISSLHFSAGGFQARYGDKMASVLDIRYHRPDDFSANVDMSLLGGSVHLEDTVGRRFTYNTGFRYKSNRYLLNSLDVEGDYEPAFYDLQTFLTYRLSSSMSLEFLGNYNLNRFRFVPQSRETSFGTIQNALSLNVYYEGQEEDEFENYMGAITFRYHPAPNLNLRWSASAYQTLESENYDILGEYYLNELDRAIGSDTYGDSIMNIGVGGYLEHARNRIEGNIHTLSHRGKYDTGRHLIEWGIKYKGEQLKGHTNEWTYVDSAGYSIPYSDTAVNLYHSLYSRHKIYTSRWGGYLQDTYRHQTGVGTWYLNGGLRVSYWSLNREWLVSPRFNVTFEPRNNPDLSWHLAAGYYYQPAFYKEMIGDNGTLNRDIRAQKSLHGVVGAEYHFIAWGRPFQYQAEAYYKSLHRLIPYKVDNIRIDYAGENMARGYAAGLDMKVNGEFVSGAQSWASLSLMQTRADIHGDFYLDEQGKRVYPGYYPRPTDQLVNFSLFFQDYVPSHPSYKMQLSLHYGSRLPFSPPNTERYDKVFRMPPYRRVDIGFSKLIRGGRENRNNHQLLQYIRSVWIGLEVFNLLDIDNTISYQWIRTVGNQQGRAGQYAVPNYLTSRRLNLKLVLKL